MEPVVTINLNGNAYQLDQSAHDALRAYLDQAEAALKDNPDKGEIIRDLEQAIADKCAAFLSAHKTVVSAADMKQALSEMGPVEESSESGQQQQSGEAPRKRIYRIRDDAKIAGVCAGLGAYFDLDVNLIRLLFVIAALITSGGFVLVYVVMMFLIPSAHTSEEWAAAHGVPFNAQEVIDRAKRDYSEFTRHGPPWSWSRGHRRAWKRAMRERARAWSWQQPPMAPVSYAGSVVGGVVALIAGLLRVVIAIVFFALLITLLTTGSLGYWTLPAHMQVWQGVFILVAVYLAISLPLRAIRYGAYGRGYHGGDGILPLAILAVGA